jgi:hypothetical protein
MIDIRYAHMILMLETEQIIQQNVICDQENYRAHGMLVTAEKKI